MFTAGSPQSLWHLKQEYFVPVTVDVQVDGLRVVDTLVWDLHQQQVRSGTSMLAWQTDSKFPQSVVAVAAYCTPGSGSVLYTDESVL